MMLCAGCSREKSSTQSRDQGNRSGENATGVGAEPTETAPAGASTEPGLGSAAPAPPIFRPAARMGKLVEAASFGEYQPTGVAISRNGRIFVNFPLWSRNHQYSLAEVMKDGTLKPFPDESWNRWQQGDNPREHFVCVQSVYVDRDDMLWVLDPAGPNLGEVVSDGPKLVKVDLSNNRVAQTIAFDETVAPKRSYLNDVRVDTQSNFAYITESGQGAIIVTDLKTGQSRRLLDKHPSTKAEKDLAITIHGQQIKDSSGNPPQINADGIALDPQGQYLYYKALTGKTLYRIKTSALQDVGISEADLGKAVESLGQTMVSDGMIMDGGGQLYLTAMEQSGIVRYRPADKTMELVAQDDKLMWPDSLAISPDNELYVTDSQIQLMPRFSGGQDKHMSPYKLYRITGLQVLPMPAMPVVGMR